jgi:hypothetical protein
VTTLKPAKYFAGPNRNRQFATGRDFFDKPVAQELADGLCGCTPFDTGRSVNRTLRVLCGGGQQHKLRIGEFGRRHGSDLLVFNSCATDKRVAPARYYECFVFDEGGVARAGQVRASMPCAIQ